LEQPKTVNLQQRVDDSYTKFLYRGRVGKGIEMSLIYLVQSIENLLKEGYKYKIQLGIQENDFSRMHFNTYSCTELLPRLPYDEVQGSLCLADVLIIAYDFDDVSNISMRFSMPTKVTEYMASGVPILVFAPRNFAVTKYALNEKWGFVVDTEDETLLSNALNRLVKDQVLRMQLVINARNTVEKFHDENDIRVKFLNALIKGYSG
jgi:glycosyltransferase involved in cell wall biosynthesis